MTFIDIDVDDSTPDKICEALSNNARVRKDQHLVYDHNGMKLTVTCVPDVIDRVEWFHDGLHISAGYAKVLIERSLQNESS